MLENIRTLQTIEMNLPKALEELRGLVYNLWWCWQPRGRRLFSFIDAELWNRYRNPIEVMINVDPHRLDALVRDNAFMSSYRSVIHDFKKYMDNRDKTWFAQSFPDFKKGSIAYFSTEFGLHESLSIYCGGLGVLSGDHCKSASDLGLPFIGVGPLYKNGYFKQEIGPLGEQQHFYSTFVFSRLPILPVQDKHGAELKIKVDLPGREISVKVWKAQVGRIPLLLLDTDLLENDPCDRPITGQLYVSGREMRICQEIVLGMGGVRVLEALEIEPSVWHMNEGHSAFMGLERVRSMVVEDKVDVSSALKKVAKNTLFTTHTPVPAGNEAFDVSLIRKYFQNFCHTTNLSMDDLIAMGMNYDNIPHQPFSLTVLAIHLSSFCNGVSKLHGEVSNDMWKHLWKGEEKKPVRYITNGVHTRTWVGQEMSDIFFRYLGPDWDQHLSDIEFFKKIYDVPDEDLWEIHQSQKERLIRVARQNILNQFARHGKSPDEMRFVKTLLNPKTLTIGFARRFATYKRADLLFKDWERLVNILNHEERPVQILFSGKAHPADKEGQAIIQRIFEIAYKSELSGHVVFLENYNMRIGRALVQGVDVWLNNPRRPREASGTSGQKVPINGGINFSILDGWWPEGYDGKNGWAIGNTEVADNLEQQDYIDSSSLYEILENQIAPTYYKRGEDGIPHDWIQIMKHSMASLIPRFSMDRQVQDYTNDAYVPLAL